MKLVRRRLINQTIMLKDLPERVKRVDMLGKEKKKEGKGKESKIIMKGSTEGP